MNGMTSGSVLVFFVLFYFLPRMIMTLIVLSFLKKSLISNYKCKCSIDSLYIFVAFMLFFFINLCNTSFTLFKFVTLTSYLVVSSSSGSLGLLAPSLSLSLLNTTCHISCWCHLLSFCVLLLLPSLIFITSICLIFHTCSLPVARLCFSRRPMFPDYCAMLHQVVS